MKQIEVSAKKIDEAIRQGLIELRATYADVKVEILQQGGLFRKAKVRLTLVDDDEDLTALEKMDKILNEGKKPEPKKEEVKTEKAEKPVKPVENRQPKPERKPEQKSEKQQPKPEQKSENRPPKQEKKQENKRPEKKEVKPVKPVETHENSEQKEVREVSAVQVELARNYLSALLERMGITAEIVIDTTHGSIDIDLVTEDTAVIGHRGETLDAFQILTKRAVEEGDDKFVHVNVDSRGYRVRREQTLVSLANKMAAKCVRTGRKVVLEPMSNTHRKIIHATLSENHKVITKSEGREPNRHVVIFPKRGDRRPLGEKKQENQDKQ